MTVVERLKERLDRCRLIDTEDDNSAEQLLAYGPYTGLHAPADRVRRGQYWQIDGLRAIVLVLQSSPVSIAARIVRWLGGSMEKIVAVATVLVAMCACPILDAHAQETTPTFTETQALSGEAAYGEHCAVCHGENLRGAGFAPALIGDAFVRHWAGRPVGDLVEKIVNTMPPGKPGSVSLQAGVDMVAYILETYGLGASSSALPRDLASLNQVRMPDRDTMTVKGKSPYGLLLAPDVVLPRWPAPPSRLKTLSSIDEKMLRDPPAASWLTWRRTRDAHGYSPLSQISESNVQRLQVAWTIALPPGPNEGTPLVHDGIMFVQSYGEHIHAFDASTGDVLWHYQHELPMGALTLIHRNIALYGDKVYFTTSDARVIALAAATGKVLWDVMVGDPQKRTNLATSGPLVVDGVLMQGVLGSGAVGGGYIVGLDAETGRSLWKFHTIPRPGEPNGDSWNGLDWEKRSGGSIWTAGSYASAEGIALFGPSPTYDTESLRDPISQPGITNDALYTNSTIALDPKTGKLVWYYQHFQNDQWDLDWAFERQVVNLEVNGALRSIVITAGKGALYDALDAKTGDYIFSIDLGLQNLVTKVDPKTGRKTINRDLTPRSGVRVTVCPDAAGAKSWLPGSYDPTHQVLFVPLVEACMDISSSRKGVFGKGQTIELRPRRNSDGRYGRLQAINLADQHTVWTVRQRAPQTTGILSTAGGLLFAGALDRWFTAYASTTGKILWRVRLSDVPNSNPITYAVDGRQYVAMVVGAGYGQAQTFYPLVPEIQAPPAESSALWVFALRD